MSSEDTADVSYEACARTIHPDTDAALQKLTHARAVAAVMSGSDCDARAFRNAADLIVDMLDELHDTVCVIGGYAPKAKDRA